MVEVANYPRQLIQDELLPPYSLRFINQQQHNTMAYEMQHSTTTLPFYHTSPSCTFHLDMMRDSLVFQLYFVTFDCLFLVVIAIVVCYSTIMFFLEIRKGNAFRQAATSGGAAGAANRRRFWTLPRLSFLSTAILFVSNLLSHILFTVYWLVTDFEGVFLIELTRYIELYHFFSLILYLVATSFVKIMQLNVLNMPPKQVPASPVQPASESQPSSEGRATSESQPSAEGQPSLDGQREKSE